MELHIIIIAVCFQLTQGYAVRAKTQVNLPSNPAGYGALDNSARFITEGRHIKVVQTDTVTLPCRVANIGKLVRAWKKGIAILTAGDIKVSPDDRLSLVNGYDLEIRSVRSEDEGDYVCQIASLQPQEITHTLEVLVPPKILEVSGGGIVEAKKGTPVTLECRAKGNPQPFYQWIKKTNNTYNPSLRPTNGSTILLGEVNRHQAGVYRCLASNGVGKVAARELTLRVLYAPEVTADEAWVHSGIGNQAVLSCTVYAEPEAEVRWYRSSLKLDVTDDHVTETSSNRHRLIIRQVQLQDLDNYTCEAQNNFGKAKQYIVLSGKPQVAVFRSNPASRWRDSYNISWTVFSYTPLEEHKLFFRRKQFTGQIPNSLKSEVWGGNLTFWYLREWTDVTLPSTPGNDITQQMSYLIRGLEPEMLYEAKVQARNTFGWNQMSDVFTFHTANKDSYSWEPSQDIFHSPETEIRDLGVTALGEAHLDYEPSLLLLVILMFHFSL
ncbi:limbic system-associated membrane protein-like isoform X2 [Cimex lectularius]|uniref:Ig-like domain-containing protein n=1 Tax=Cimex lectularius TaxID=79782 RepID=A0A8I6TDY8_CIMLE|nr:limbic system-associated membrane protein-like isoform X2 [Cimex lectularius]